MFFYIIHNINHYLLSGGRELVADGSKNVQTLIFGGLLYLLFHAILSKSIVNFTLYFWWLFSIDVIAMSVIYKQYYSKSILSEVKVILADSSDVEESTQKDKHVFLKKSDVPENKIIDNVLLLNDSQSFIDDKKDNVVIKESEKLATSKVDELTLSK